MKTIWMLSLLLALTVSSGGSVFQAEMQSEVAPIAAQHQLASLTMNEPAIEVQAEAVQEEQVFTEPVVKLLEVNHISLDDSPADLVDKLGAPLAIAKDEWFPELEIYEYEGLKVVYRENYIDYVEVAATAPLQLDGMTVEVSTAALIDVLGTPDYIADDGIVFERGERVLKLFYEEGTEKPSYVSYFYDFTI